jgi:hypothetical protein
MVFSMILDSNLMLTHCFLFVDIHELFQTVHAPKVGNKLVWQLFVQHSHTYSHTSLNDGYVLRYALLGGFVIM